MNSQKLTTHFNNNKVEVTLNLPSGCDKTYSSVPDTISDIFCEEIECEELSGTFQNEADDELNYGGEGFELSGSWRVLELPYELIYRLVMWRNNHFTPSDFTLELFIKNFGEMAGNEYYLKWLDQKGDLLDMFGCFVSDPEDGQTFCNMVMEQIEKYEKQEE